MSGGNTLFRTGWFLIVLTLILRAAIGLPNYLLLLGFGIGIALEAIHWLRYFLGK